MKKEDEHILGKLNTIEFVFLSNLLSVKIEEKRENRKRKKKKRKQKKEKESNKSKKENK